MSHLAGVHEAAVVSIAIGSVKLSGSESYITDNVSLRLIDR